ncbi:BTAD domain-containing putative transcriptional regulator [Streptomyces sp. NPDC046870]|uniref:AfsR/SARP family transcriptional regulator n=1 Tax=Streptomyces sp. NPDC046870 TaxID=3155135 RepID=UPI003456B282
MASLPDGPGDGTRSGTLRFEVLGPLRVLRAGTELDLGYPQARTLLGVLVVWPGRTVRTGTIVDVLWPGRPPVSARNAVRRHVGTLRRLLEPGLPPRSPGRRLLGRTGGYLLEAAADEADLLRFRAFSRRGMRAAATARPEQAVRHFVSALRLWRGPVVADLPGPVRAHPHFAAVDREVLRTARMAADAALLCGRADQVLPSLRRAVALNPLDEPLLARLILSLAACGLQADALAAYEDARRGLAAQLGAAPGAELAAAHARVLRQQIRPARHRLPTVPPSPARPFVRPAQLPPDLPVFIGRGRELAALDRLLGGAPVGSPPGSRSDGASARATPDALGDADASTGARPASAVLISGPAGVGKTALAVHWAHRVTDRFPDGRLHLELGGSALDQAALEPAEALRRLLAALGAPARDLHAGVTALAARYRGALAGRRLLVLLDDAACLGQIRPLLPEVPGCLTVVTSRGGSTGPGAVTAGTGAAGETGAEEATGATGPTGPTTPAVAVAPATATVSDPAGPAGHLGLPPPLERAAAGLRTLRLGLPSAEDARELLARRIGAARLAAEPEAVTEILRRCGRLPSALALVAARAATRRDFPLAALAADLAEDTGP